MKQTSLSPKKSVNSSQIEDVYRIHDQILGEGASSVVKLCEHRISKQVYAVKIIRNCDEETASQMQKTFKMQQRLDHAKIIKCFDLFIDRFRNCIFLVMEYCAFPSLLHLIQKSAPLNEHAASLIIHSLCEVVRFVHEQGIVHRDIKPDNILVNPEDLSDIKVLDF